LALLKSSVPSVTGVLTVMIRGVVMGLVKVATLSVPWDDAGAPLGRVAPVARASFFQYVMTPLIQLVSVEIRLAKNPLDLN